MVSAWLSSSNNKLILISIEADMLTSLISFENTLYLKIVSLFIITIYALLWQDLKTDFIQLEVCR